jgi:hypothetical protein
MGLNNEHFEGKLKGVPEGSIIGIQAKYVEWEYIYEKQTFVSGIYKMVFLSLRKP